MTLHISFHVDIEVTDIQEIKQDHLRYVIPSQTGGPSAVSTGEEQWVVEPCQDHVMR